MTEQENKIMCAFFKKLDNIDYEQKIKNLSSNKYNITNANKTKREILVGNPILGHLNRMIRAGPNELIQVTDDDLKNC